MLFFSELIRTKVNCVRYLRAFSRVWHGTHCMFSCAWHRLPLQDWSMFRPWQTRTHCCRHKCSPVCPRAQHFLRSGTQKMSLILFRNILCPQQMFPSLSSPRNIMGNNVSATMCLRLPRPFECLRLLCQYFSANFHFFKITCLFFFFSEIVIFMIN